MSNRTTNYMMQNISSLIYSEVQIEGYECTFEDTSKIIEQGYAEGMSEEAIQCIINLKHAWGYLFDYYNVQPEWNNACIYNGYLERGFNDRPGQLRYGTPYIPIRTGELYYPPVPSMQDANHVFYQIYNESTPIRQALTALVLFAKKQFFDDGNKRTSQMMANHILAHYDTGSAFCVPFDQNGEFKRILGQFYIDNYSQEDTINMLSQFVI